MTARARKGALALTAAALGVIVVFLAAGGVVPRPETWSLAADAFYDDRPRAAERLAREALAERPLDGRAWAVLARVALQQGDVPAARAHVARAVGHAPRHAAGLALAGELALAADELPLALRHYDQLLRVHPYYAAEVEPVLLQLAARPQAHRALLQALESRPGWRGAFLRRLAREAPDTVALQGLFNELSLRDGLRPAEVADYLGRLVGAGEVATARQTWRALWEHPLTAGEAGLPRQAEGAVWDSGFELDRRLGAPFEWQIDTVPGVEAGVRLSPRGEGQHLRLSFAGRRAAYRGVRQLLTLPPGDWQLSWDSRYESLETPQGLRWVLRCLPGNTELLATPPRRGMADWRRETARFTVPGEGCTGQWLQLELRARIPAETLARGSVWIDNVAVAPP